MSKLTLTRKEQEKIIKEVVKRYGNIINLKETPFVLIEILRDFKNRLPDDGGAPPGGAPTPPGPAAQQVENTEILQAILKLTKEVVAIKKQLSKK